MLDDLLLFLSARPALIGFGLGVLAGVVGTVVVGLFWLRDLLRP